MDDISKADAVTQNFRMCEHPNCIERWHEVLLFLGFISVNGIKLLKMILKKI